MLCRGGPEQVRGERKSTLLQLLRRRCVHRKISRRLDGERESECAEMAEKRCDDEKKEETKGDKRERKEMKRKRGGRINSKVGEGAFSDEIRSRGRSEFGNLIHERGKHGIAESKGRGNRGGEDAQVRTSVSIFLSFSLSPPLALSPLLSSSLFLPAAAATQMGLHGSRTSNDALSTPPPRVGTN